MDLRKAYDKLNWDFIHYVLKAYGFPLIWINLIEQCIMTVSYKVMVNGNLSTSFKPKGGLLQGDPLSSYLFILGMDVFSRMCSISQDIGLFSGIKLTRRSPTISHLLFADDVMLFFKITNKAATKINNIVQNFSKSQYNWLIVRSLA